MNNSAIRRYCKRVGRYLMCRKAHKKGLLDGLMTELSDQQLPPDVSMRELIIRFGEPRETAEQLQTSVDAEEAYHMRKREKRRIIMIAGAVLLFVSACAVMVSCYFIKHEPYYYKENVVIVSDDNTQDDGNVWGPVVTNDK